MLPSFIAIGPGKSGTTWLYECLKEHPQICLAYHIKETMFFDRYYYKGIEWYERFFCHCKYTSVIGEISNTYFFSPDVPARMKRIIPDIKLITCLRNPIDRIYSLYLFRVRNGFIRVPFEEAIRDDPSMVTDNFYFDHLSNYLRYFDRNQMYIGIYDDLKENPHKFIQEIYKFLGVDISFIPSRLYERILPASAPRNKILFRLAKRCALIARDMGMFSILGWAKQSKVLYKILLRPYTDKDYPKIRQETRTYLYSVFQDQLVQLSELIGRDLSHWQ